MYTHAHFFKSHIVDLVVADQTCCIYSIGLFSESTLQDFFGIYFVGLFSEKYISLAPLYICTPQTKEIGLKIITTVKISTNFHGSLRIYQTHFHGSPQVFIQVFGCVNGVPVTQKI